MTEEQLEDNIWEIYNKLTTDDRCQPISWAEVQHLKEISAMCKWELERRTQHGSNE